MRIPRIHIPDLPAAGDVAIPAPAAHHLRSVLRLKPGDPIIVFDGEGQAYRARLTQLARRDAAAATLEDAVEAGNESPLRLVLAVAPLKGDGLAWVVEKATELGVSEIWLVETHRTDQAARTALSGPRLDRLRRIAASAAEQSERTRIPTIVPPAALPAVLERPIQGPRLICVERSAHAWPDHSDRPTEALLLIGPHGGWTDDEIAVALAAGCQPASLGPRVLRAETAALAALTLAQATWGDGRT